MPPCRFGKIRPHNDAARNMHESRLPKRMHAAAKSYSVDCVHGIGLLLCYEKYPVYGLGAAEKTQCVLSSENGVICAYVRYERAMEIVASALYASEWPSGCI